MDYILVIKGMRTDCEESRAFSIDLPHRKAAPAKKGAGSPEQGFVQRARSSVKSAPQQALPVKFCAGQHPPRPKF